MKLALALIVLVTSVMASAQSRIVSVDAFDMTYTGGLLIKNDDAKKGSDREETTFKLNLNYSQSIEQYEGVMWKALVFFNREDIDWGNDTLNSRYGVGGGIIYNFQANDIKNSFMAGALVGIERQTVEFANTDDESGFNFFVLFEGGKRWDMGQYAKLNLSYAPTASFQWKRYGGDIRKKFLKSGTELKLNFLKFDVLF